MIACRSRLKSSLKGSLKGDAGERSETAFILPAKKANRRPSDPWGSLGLGSQHKASDQKSQMEIYSPQANVNFNSLYCYNVKYSLCATMFCYSTQSEY